MSLPELSRAAAEATARWYLDVGTARPILECPGSRRDSVRR